MMLSKEEKAKLSWRCRRGMLELDLILKRFLERKEQFSEQELQAFQRLLTQDDPLLLAWLMGHEDPKDEELLKIVHTIRNHS